MVLPILELGIHSCVHNNKSSQDLGVQYIRIAADSQGEEMPRQSLPCSLWSLGSAESILNTQWTPPRRHLSAPTRTPHLAIADLSTSLAVKRTTVISSHLSPWLCCILGFYSLDSVHRTWSSPSMVWVFCFTLIKNLTSFPPTHQTMFTQNQNTIDYRKVW